MPQSLPNKGKEFTKDEVAPQFAEQNDLNQLYDRVAEVDEVDMYDANGDHMQPVTATGVTMDGISPGQTTVHFLPPPGLLSLDSIGILVGH